MVTDREDVWNPEHGWAVCVVVWVVAGLGLGAQGSHVVDGHGGESDKMLVSSDGVYDICVV